MAEPWISRQLRAALCWLACFSIALAAGVKRTHAEEHDETLEAIAQVYSANREKFRTFTCRFRFSDGRTASKDDAAAGKFVPRKVQHGLWIVDGEDSRYELICEGGELSHADLQRIGPDADRLTAVSCASRIELYLGKERIRASVSHGLNAANLHVKGLSEVVNTPISMGTMAGGEKHSPLQFIRGYQAGTRYCKYLGQSRVGDATVDVLETGLRKTADPQITLTWHLDLARGGIPLKVVVANPDGSVRWQTDAGKIIRLENGAYLCQRSVTWGKVDDEWNSAVIELESIDLSKPARETLAVTVPEKCRIIDSRDLRRWVRVPKAEIIHVDDLPKWIERCEANGKTRIEEQKRLGIGSVAARRTSGARRLNYWAIAGGGLAMFVIAGVLLRRYLYTSVG